MGGVPVMPLCVYTVLNKFLTSVPDVILPNAIVNRNVSVNTFKAAPMGAITGVYDRVTLFDDAAVQPIFWGAATPNWARVRAVNVDFIAHWLLYAFDRAVSYSTAPAIWIAFA
jgi:hypothetical protein